MQESIDEKNEDTSGVDDQSDNVNQDNDSEACKESNDECTNSSEGSNSSDKKIDEKLKEIDGLKDRYLRLMAEFDNYKRRTQKEKESLYSDVKVEVVKEILPVLDNLERAFTTIKDSADESVLKGIEMVIKQFNDSFMKLGVEYIETKEVEFDPNMHNAVMHEENDSEEKNKIIEEFQKGYKIGDKVVRHSMVKVLN